MNQANRAALDLEMKANLWNFHNATTPNAKANAQAKLGACCMILAANGTTNAYTGDVESDLAEMYAVIDEVGGRYVAA